LRTRGELKVESRKTKEFSIEIVYDWVSSRFAETRFAEIRVRD